MKKSWRPPTAWQDFELLCYELLSAEHPESHSQLYGRAGQDQHGVDILIADAGVARPIGVQCKLRNELNGGALTQTSVVEMYNVSCRYPQGLRALQIATTSLKNTAVQDMCAQITNSWQHRYPVQPLFWQDFENLLDKHSEVACRFYPEAFAADRCVATSRSGKLTVSLPPTGWEARLKQFFSHPAFARVAGPTADWLHGIVAELVDNALDPTKGGASVVRLELGADRLDLLDDGREFDSARAPLPPRGKQWGLRAIRETVDASQSALRYEYLPADTTTSRLHTNRITIDPRDVVSTDPCRSSMRLKYLFSREEARRYAAKLPFSEDCTYYTLRLSEDGLYGLAHSAAFALLKEVSARIDGRPLVLELDEGSYITKTLEEVASELHNISVRKVR